jgi:hypothetical protein
VTFGGGWWKPPFPAVASGILSVHTTLHTAPGVAISPGPHLTLITSQPPWAGGSYRKGEMLLQARINAIDTKERCATCGAMVCRDHLREFHKGVVMNLPRDLSLIVPLGSTRRSTPTTDPVDTALPHPKRPRTQKSNVRPLVRCVEDEFCELRLLGVLGSSHAGSCIPTPAYP